MTQQPLRAATAAYCDALRTSIAEYDAEAARLQHWVQEFLHIPPPPAVTAGRLQFLAELATLLDVRTAEPAALMLALHDVERKNILAEAKLAEREAELRHWEAALLPAVFSERERTQRLCEHLRAQTQQRALDSSTAEGQLALYLTKQAEYRERLAELDNQMHASGAGPPPGCSHDEILALYNQVEEIEKRLRPKRARLRGFLDLPPEPRLAQRKLEERLRELEGLRRRFSDRVETLGMR
eukprot:TRINITY_DN49322_c0_g1_i1.p1 TRINITY_DN49322_c0_g1~~TRINITY_DN49322_c0_g1_i1.p1  ORF type:complete len:240 (+),score=41.28 TRINITY_DN49322_c0_g1_i1:26-745(+)